MSAVLPDLPYAYNALEPYICEEIMTLHHKKHHQTYVNGLNAAEQSFAAAATPREKIALQAAYKFNGGGHINHSLFWKNMAPAAHGAKHGAGCGGVLKPGPLADAINQNFGSLDEMKKQFNAATLAIQGSGWGWLVLKPNGSLAITTTPNQDPVIDAVPLIGIDIWEHAFYIQYKNVKPDYLNAIWNVINFEEAEKRFVHKNSGL
ncbi:hypothetical protein M408DRAFT_24465 [Serendipita vermifera MAFF 305830]|uniref:Superoxide dismutase n=1 Tax=Serendipita vermifera MAFF 305830 TaxID=933852 RepID=A0A0C3B5R7_SERVB|nr:hypothetical protein M408DRAFT_24465 [Serendipita vermifera MAFF 305830]